MPSDWNEVGTLTERARVPATLSLSLTMKEPNGSRDNTCIATSLNKHSGDL
jgi:hypothetical protein